MNNDDGEVIITEDQPEEITDPEPADPKVRFSIFEFYQNSINLSMRFGLVSICSGFFYLHGIVFNLTIWRFDNES